jgi:hypothetical protein
VLAFPHGEMMFEMNLCLCNTEILHNLYFPHCGMILFEMRLFLWEREN